jgi:threonine dehydrogenase-like Zn-dependent dehydrogenase
VADVISHRLPLSEAPQAMRIAREAKEAMKILVHP